MKRGIKLEKRHALVTFFIALLVAIALLVYAYQQPIPNPGHGGDQIFIALSSGYISLQDAITSGVLKGPPMLLSSAGAASLVGIGHPASNIWIKLNGKEETLQDAINNNSLCCSSCIGDSVYTQLLPPQANYASQVKITNQSGTEETLQKAIDNKEFCSCGDKTCDSARGENCSSCSADCGVCPYCGDLSCNGAETCGDCPGDCGACACVVTSCPCDNNNNCGTYYCGDCPRWYDPGDW